MKLKKNKNKKKQLFTHKIWSPYSSLWNFNFYASNKLKNKFRRCKLSSDNCDKHFLFRGKFFI